MSRARTIADFGDGIADADLPAGSVLQVVQGTASGQDATSSESFVATSLSASITPSSASNKILITYTGRHAHSASDVFIYTSIFRDGTEVTGESNGLAQVYTDGQRPFVTTGATFLDSPSTTSSVTYAVCFKKLFSGEARFGSTSQKAVITLMEIAG
jgi:hypothetical protein